MKEKLANLPLDELKKLAKSQGIKITGLKKGLPIKKNRDLLR